MFQVITICGTPQTSGSKNGTCVNEPQFNKPRDFILNETSYKTGDSEHIYVADTFNHVIRLYYDNNAFNSQSNVSNVTMFSGKLFFFFV